MQTDQEIAAAVAALKALPADGHLARTDLAVAAVLRDPDRYLGPFKALPAHLRAYLVRLYADDEEVRALATGHLSAGLLHTGARLSRTLYRLERLVGRRAARIGAWQVRRARLREWLRRMARQSTHLPFVLRRRLRQVRARLAAHTGRRDLATVLHAAGFDLRSLGFSYLEDLPQHQGCAAVLRTGSMDCALLVGFDFVCSGGVHWFLEANCNPALMDARLTLYPADADPWVENLLRCAAAHGFHRLSVYGYRPFSRGHADALVAAGRRRGMDVVIVDDLFSAPVPGHRCGWLIDESQTAGTFVVRAKTFDVLVDRAVLSKRQTRRILEPHAEMLAKGGVALPRLFTPGSPIPTYQAEAPFPTVVAKVDGLDRGAGVSFYKLPSIPVALADRADYFEEYRVPDPCLSRTVRGRRLPLEEAGPRAWKVRSYALLTPDGVEYLSSIKVISGRPVPARLPDGPVAQKNIYLATVNEGGMYSAVTVEEDDGYRRAVAVVGDALLHWLWRKYPGAESRARPSLSKAAAG